MSEHREFCKMLWDAAWDLDKRARSLRELAAKIEHPPPGVTVKVDYRGTVRFIGPPLAVSAAAAPENQT